MYRAQRLLAALFLTIASGAASAESRLALVIGNSAYETVSALPNPANDARAMAELLTAAGFEVISAPNLSQSAMRQAIGEFAGLVSRKGADTVTFVFYAGHGLQVDGENYLVPVDARIQRETDVPLHAVRLVDVMNTLGGVPSKARIVVLDACRNNPFSEINKTTGRGLAIVDAPTGSLVSYSTAPGAEALDGDAENSPFTAAFLKAAREPGIPIEQALKRVRWLVHDATRQQQTPWESSSLTSDFALFPGAAAASKPATGDSGTARRPATHSVESWRKDFRSKQAAEAYALVIEEGTPEAFEAYLGVYSVAPYAPRVRSLLERRREMIAWYNAVTLNSAASYQTFLTAYANSDLAVTAQRLMERARNRALANLPAVTPTCACSLPQPPVREKRAKNSRKEKQASRSTEEKGKRGKKSRRFVSDDEIDGPPPTPVGGSGPPVSIGIGIPIRGVSVGGWRGGPTGGRGTHVPQRPTSVPTRPTGMQYR